MQLYMIKRICLLAIMMVITMGTRAQQRYSDGLDDVMQYVPYASVFALKACGVESRDDWKKLVITTAASWAVTAGAGWILKQSIKEWRPDDSDQKSFPSGHSMIAFAGAWISVAGYGVAAFVAVDRVAKDRHHWYDAATGAALGFGLTELTWWLLDKVFPRQKDKIAFGTSGTTLDVIVGL